MGSRRALLKPVQVKRGLVGGAVGGSESRAWSEWVRKSTPSAFPARGGDSGSQKGWVYKVRLFWLSEVFGEEHAV